MLSRTRWLALALIATAGSAAAQPLDYVVVDPPRTRAAGGATTIYLNPCPAGCTVTAGSDSARADTSSILGRNATPATVTLAPFAWDQATWDGMVACVRERYAPWDVTVVTAEPAGGRYLEVMVAGLPAALGLPGNTLGVAPLTSDCSPLPSAIAFAFANAHQAEPAQIENLCTTVIHEAGHLYGLDHEFACRDPMTYLDGCGAKLFVNRSYPCGETDGERPCKCGATQNSFVALTEAIGPGAAPAPPAAHLISPPDGGAVNRQFSVFVQLDSARTVADVTLWINGRSWVRVPGKVTSSLYELVTPAAVPDGALDLEVRIRDDLGNVGVLTRSVTKGAPCVDGQTCPADATCVAGGCRFAAGTGALGGGCAVDDDCAGKLCAVADGIGTCSQPCYPAGATCPAGLTCRAGDDEGLACLPPVETAGGCCSTGAGAGAPPLVAVLAVAGWLRRRRRRW